MITKKLVHFMETNIKVKINLKYRISLTQKVLIKKL